MTREQPNRHQVSKQARGRGREQTDLFVGHFCDAIVEIGGNQADDQRLLQHGPATDRQAQQSKQGRSKQQMRVVRVGGHHLNILELLYAATQRKRNSALKLARSLETGTLRLPALTRRRQDCSPEVDEPTVLARTQRRRQISLGLGLGIGNVESNPVRILLRNRSRNE